MAEVMAVTKKDRLRGGQSLTPPEGGWGWMIVIGCFLATICIRAVTRCVSMFFLEFQMHFEKDYSTTAWIHSLIDSTTMLCAPLGSFLGNQLSCRATVMLGGLLSCTGLILSSFASSLEYLYISMGILTGLGFALSYTPAIAMVGRYFNERKALAYGIALSGSGIGTFLLAPAVQLIIEHYSWRGALLILGGFVSNLLVCGALMRPLVTRAEGRTLEYNVTNPAHKVTVLDSKPVSPDCSQVEPKQLGLNNMKETQGLCLANETFKNFGNNILSQGNVTLLPNPRLSDRGLKIAECILFSNKLTETVLGEIEFSDQLSNSSMTEELKVVESMKFNNEEADMFAQIEDLRFCEATPTDKTISPSPQTFVNKHTTSGGECFCLKSRQEFGFLMSSNFLILSVSFLFLAYGCSAPVVYLVPYALSVGVEHRHAAFLMSIFGVSGIVGNISFGWITDRQCLRRYRILSYAVAVTLEGLCCMSVPFLHSFSLLVPFCALYGYFDGAYVALIPVVTSDTVGSDYLTSALGVVYFLHAVPYLVSPPIGGWLVDQTGSYAATFFLSGASFIFSSVILAVYLLVRHSRKCNSAVRLNRTDTAAAAQQDII